MKTSLILAGVIFLLTVATYGLSAIMVDHTRTPDSAYFDHLADAFLHGHVYLLDPPTTKDLTHFNGKWYVPFLPLPALLILPWVAMAGISHTNTVIFGSIMGAMNTALVFLLLQSLSKRGWSKLSLPRDLGFTLLFGFGCVHWYIAIQGSVWFLSQTCTVSFILLSLWTAVEYGSPGLAGIALGVALFGRPNVIFVYPLLLAIGIQSLIETNRSWHGIVRWVIFSSIPLTISVLLILGYNYLRFQNVFDFGYLTENVDPTLASDLHRYGQFSIHYLPHNLWAMVLAGPDWDRGQNLIVANRDGMSIFLTTPAMIYIFQTFKKSWLTIGGWLALILLLIPLLTYYNTGWWQFGYRFSLDFMPVVIVLLALHVTERLTLKIWILIFLGVIINALGVWWFAHLPR